MSDDYDDGWERAEAMEMMQDEANDMRDELDRLRAHLAALKPLEDAALALQASRGHDARRGIFENACIEGRGEGRREAVAAIRKELGNGVGNTWCEYDDLLIEAAIDKAVAAMDAIDGTATTPKAAPPFESLADMERLMLDGTATPGEKP